MDDYTNSPAAPYPPTPPPPPQSNVLPKLLVVLMVLIAILAAPLIVERIQFAITRGRERAEVEVARESLQHMELNDLERAFASVAKSMGPSVVHIDTVKVVNGRSEDEFANVFGPQQYEAKGQGSGVIIDAEGYVLTNNHVIDGAEDIQVALSDGRSVGGRVLGADPLTDLAVLKIDSGDLTPAPWGDSDKLEVGSMVWAIGNPFGLDRSVTFGIISAKSRRGFGSSVYQEFLQTDAAINPGNSGGPLVDAQGQIIGINTAIIGQAYQGIGFSIPSNTARQVYERLKSSGKVARGWLGVALDDLKPDVAKQLGLKTIHGALVQDVIRNGPADKAGIEAGDVVIGWNDQNVDDRTSLSLLVAKTDIGSTAKAKIIRDGNEKSLDVVVEERPSQLERRRRK